MQISGTIDLNIKPDPVQKKRPRLPEHSHLASTKHWDPLRYPLIDPDDEEAAKLAWESLQNPTEYVRGTIVDSWGELLMLSPERQQA